jgi:opacity protein-like surface antigen
MSAMPIFVSMRKMNITPKLSRLKPGKLKPWLACLVLLTVLALPRVQAGTEMQPSSPPTCGLTDKEWTLELGSGATFSNVRSGQPNQPYTLVPIDLTASLKLDDVSLDNVMGGVLRGYSEFFFQGQYQDIVRGPETHYEGIMVGPRYNFVQPGWKVVPFIEGGVGVGFAESRPEAGGLGQDFNFSFEMAAGAKYLINDDFFLRLTVEYQHVSNAGLSEPQFDNHPIDALGPILSFGYAF